MKLDIKWIPLLIITAINVGLWQLAPFEGLPVSAWHTVIIFVQPSLPLFAKWAKSAYSGL
jgi:putative sodium:sulfate symporter